MHEQQIGEFPHVSGAHAESHAHHDEVQFARPVGAPRVFRFLPVRGDLILGVVVLKERKEWWTDDGSGEHKEISIVIFWVECLVLGSLLVKILDQVQDGDEKEKEEKLVK